MLNTNFPLIKIKNLKKSFGVNKVLDGIDLDIPKGSIFSILGKSGTGKSVLIKCLIHLLHADSGEIWYNNLNISTISKKHLSKIMNDFGYLFQESALFDSLTVEENIAFPIREVLKIHDKKTTENRIKELLNWVEMPNTQHLLPSELSGGMKKRVGFARTLAMNPKIMLCDEPTTGLDPVTGRTIIDLVKRANQELGITCIMISHDIPGAIRISDYLSLLDEGKIRVCADVQGFLKGKYPLLQQFIKYATINHEGNMSYD